MTKIGDHAYYNCTNLSSVVIPDNVTEIGYDAFNGCSFTSINIPKSMATIGEEAFKDCSNLISIIIPESVAVIEAYAFKECDNLTSVTILNGEIRIKLNYSEWLPLVSNRPISTMPHSGRKLIMKKNGMTSGLQRLEMKLRLVWV